MHIDEAKLAWPWLSEDEVRERVQNAIDRGKVVLATDEEVERVERGDWMRVGTNTICTDCGKEYLDHPYLDYCPWLHRLCNGILGKT